MAALVVPLLLVVPQLEARLGRRSLEVGETVLVTATAGEAALVDALALGEVPGLRVEAGPVRVLLVICRPRAGDDVPFRSVAGRLIKGLGAEARKLFDLRVLRPPTFEQLGRELRRARSEGKPYHASNVPFRPKKWLQVATTGVKRNDLTFVLGFGGSSSRIRRRISSNPAVRSSWASNGCAPAKSS